MSSLWSWFKASQSLKSKASRRHVAPSIDDSPLVPRYYVFYYPVGREPGSGSGWKYPKKYFGPFEDEASAKRVVQTEVKEYGWPRNRYKIRHLTVAQFSKIWGSAPGESHPGY